MRERAHSLLALGLTPEQARFLELAALQSGYFVRRQFNDYLKARCGAVAQSFIEKCLSGRLASELHCSRGRIVYHCTSYALYAALGDPNNRNRRDHQPDTVRRRLAALDYCIGRGSDYLLTEAEKVAFFRELGVNEEDLPGETFGEGTLRRFVDRQPISRDLSLGFIDDQFQGLSNWRTYLAKHRPLVKKLLGCTFVFASAEERRFLLAERAYRELVSGSDSDGGLDVARLKRYFDACTRFEARDFGSFNQARLDQLRDDRATFAGQDIERLYATWRQVGDGCLSQLKGREIRLQFHLLQDSYGWLSPIRKEIYDAAHSGSRKEGKRGGHGQA